MSSVYARADSGTTRPRSLRWWPAAVLLALMIGFTQLPKFFEAAPLPVMMVSFMGPGVVGILILVWWLLASRATIVEKILGAVGVLLVATTAIYFLHPSMQGMGATIHVVPAGMAAFAIALIVQASWPKYRILFALACAGLTFGFWDLVQSKGVTGQFNAEFDWRWNATPEQVYLASLANRAPTKLNSDSTDAVSSDNKLPLIDLASSQWPSFRGPRRDGRHAGIALNVDWKSSPPKQLWLRKIGPAWSSFTVAADRLFTQEQRGEREAVICLDANTGETVWEHVYPGRFWEAVAGAGPRGTPTIADEGLFALGADGKLVCLEPRSGKLIWQANLKADADREPPTWGFAASPLVTNGLAIVHAGGKGENGVVAYDATNGERKWSVASGDHSYSSPQLATFFSVTGILMETNAGLQFLDVATGTQLWQHAWPLQNYRALQPLVVGNTVLLAATLGAGTRSLTVAREGDVWKVTENWTSRDLKPDFNDFVEHKGFLYGFDSNIFCCTELASGKRKWKRGRYGNGQVVLLPDADQLLVSSETGELVLLQANGAEFVELGKIPAIEGKTWNHPVVVGNRIYIRNAEQAACFEVAVR